MARYLIFIALVAFSQTGITLNYATSRCGTQTTGKAYLVTLGQVSYPTCLAIGDGLKIEMVNGVATINTVTKQTSVQLVPAWSFGNTNKVPVGLIPIAGSVCGPTINPQPEYQFGSQSSVIVSETHMFVCATSRKWKRIKLEEIQ